MEEDMEIEEVEIEGMDFLCLEIDLDYEFDAPRYFDLSREEFARETWEAELWFASATGYPASPFIARLNLSNDVLVENVNTLPKFKDEENSNYSYACSNTFTDPEFSALDESCKGWAVESDMVEDILKDDKKFVNGPFSKGSTLMKPTASQLAKQNRLRDVKRSQSVHRFAKALMQKCERSIEESSEHGGHAAKRQKLDGGHLRKVVDVKDQKDLLHKAPQKLNQKNGSVDNKSQLPRLRITIPREPELETAQRARRLRVQRLRSNDDKHSEQGKMPATPIFKARPLNRKILEAPSLPLRQKSTPQLPKFQPFHLKTEERALQHSIGPSSSSDANSSFSISTLQAGAPGLRKLECQASAPSKLQNDELNRDECAKMQPKFKARPLNKKILSSKGDIGVFRSTKRETTTPIEFNFSANKRSQQDPPTELLDKLSLKTEAQQTSASQTQCLWPIHGAVKGSKENVNCTVQQGHKDIHLKKEGLQRRGVKQVGCESFAISNYSLQTNKLSNSSGIR